MGRFAVVAGWLTSVAVLLFTSQIVGRPAAAQAASVPGPSFDCSRAASADEQAICANEQLSRLDVMISMAYAQFTPTFADKRAIGRALLADRHACGSDQACIAAVEVNALETYGNYVPWADAYVQALIGEKAAELSATLPRNQDQALPQHIGDCALTHIDELITRFGDPLRGADANAGSGVVFTDGGTQISYDVVDALETAQRGDPVVLCLVSIPRDCPANDARGRIYYALDAHSGDTWQLPDSEHSCGGA